MNSGKLCIGIAINQNGLAIAALNDGKLQSMNLPASASGMNVLKGFLCRSRQPVRVAVAGTAALGLVLALTQTPVQEVFVVAAHVADQPVALAHYAERSL